MSESSFQNPLDALASGSRQSPMATMRLVQARTRLSFRAQLETAISAAGDAFGVALPRQACRFAQQGDRRALWLGPDEWLLVAPLAAAGELVTLLDKALSGMAHSLVDVSHRSVSFTVSGPQAGTVINAACPLDLGLDAFPVGMCTRTVLAKTEIVLLRTALEEFQIDVWRSYAPYAWSILEEARAEYL